MSNLRAMTAEVEELVEKALRLREQDRDELVDAILDHSDPPEDWLAHWIPIVHERMENVRNGRSETIPAETVFREARERLRNKQ